MSSNPETWPPAPGPQHAAQNPATSSEEVRTTCPACGRKLLTQTSALCNWCGAKIDDPEYQQRAAQTRHEWDEAERTQVETVVQEEARYGVFGRLRRRAKENPGRKNPFA